MAKLSIVHQHISVRIKDSPGNEKRELLNSIEHEKIRKDHLFIDYVNTRSNAAVEMKKRGEYFSSLEELQQEYT